MATKVSVNNANNGVYTIEIPRKVYDKWQLLWRNGHNKEIKRTTGLSLGTIITAVRHGRASDDTINKIDACYKDYVKNGNKFSKA